MITTLAHGLVGLGILVVTQAEIEVSMIIIYNILAIIIAPNI